MSDREDTNEPNPDDYIELTKLDLIRILNWYSVHSNETERKEWSVRWVEKNAPELLGGVMDTDPIMFFTYGALARMDFLGFPLSEDHRRRIKERFEFLSQ